MSDLFSDQQTLKQVVAPGITLLKRYASTTELMPLIQQIKTQSPLRHMGTSMGHKMRVSSTNCGNLGGYSDEFGYRYLKNDPLTQQAWPSMPSAFKHLAIKAAMEAGILNFNPDSCLINHYPIGISMGSHQDKEERDFSWPIVSVSMGLSAVFQIFGKTRSGVELEILLEDGDVLILAGPARLYYHGVKPVKADLMQPNLTDRYNMTFRQAR